MPSYHGLRQDAERIAKAATDPQVKALAKVVAELAKECVATEPAAMDAKRDARMSKKE